MQMGIVSYQLNKKEDIIYMGFIDYKLKDDKTVTNPAVVVSWDLEDNTFIAPKLCNTLKGINYIDEVGRILIALEKLKAKHKDAIKNPAKLIYLLQKQNARHVHLLNDKWEIVPRTKKESLWTEPVLGLSVDEDDEDKARIKLQKDLGAAITSNMDKMDLYVKWLKEGCKLKQVKDVSDSIIPLSVYSPATWESNNDK